jgi:excisionase family DNA binding protein
MTLSQAAEHLGVTRYTIQRLMRSGEIQAFVSPLDRRQRLLRREDVERLREPVPADEVTKMAKQEEA